MSFCFAKSVDALGEPDFKAPIVEAMKDASDCLLLFKHFPWLQTLMMLLPVPLTVKIMPQTSGIVKVKEVLSPLVKQLMKNPCSLKESLYPVVFDKLLNTNTTGSENAPNQRSLLQEAQSLLFGGSDTVSNQMMLGVWHLLDSPENVRKLKNELIEAWPVLENTPSFEDLEKLPFLVITLFKKCWAFLTHFRPQL